MKKDQPEPTRHLPLAAAKREWVRRLRALDLVKHPVKVRWVDEAPKIKGYKYPVMGYCHLVRGKNGPYFEVVVAPTHSRSLLAEVLVHEWAHAVAWFDVSDEQPHGAAWGRAYYKCYQAVIDL